MAADTDRLAFSIVVEQHHQRVRPAAEGGAQGVPAEGADAATQGQVAVGVPPAVGLLRRPVPREGPVAHRARRPQPPQVLAQSPLAQRGQSTRPTVVC